MHALLITLHRSAIVLFVCMCFRMNLVEVHFWQNDDWKDQYVGVVSRGTTGNKVKSIIIFPLLALIPE